MHQLLLAFDRAVVGVNCDEKGALEMTDLGISSSDVNAHKRITPD